jgi:ribosomal protein S4
MAAEMKSTKNMMGEEMAQFSALDLVNQTGFYQKEEKKLTSAQFDQAKTERRWAETTDEQFHDSVKKCSIMSPENCKPKQ